jgi:hypothetical protein
VPSALGTQGDLTVGESASGLAVPRSAGRLVIATLKLYRRYPLLFLILAASVIIPYELLVLAVAGSSQGAGDGASFAVEVPVGLAYWFLVTPLVSSLHVHAVTEVKNGREPRIGTVALHGLKVLPVVAAAAIASTIGIMLGFLALVIPGIILILRWAVVAQVAAIEHEGWIPALRRSADLSDGHYMHIFVFAFIAGVIANAPAVLAGVLIGFENTSAGAIVLSVAFSVVAASFAALAYALLYYDLLARWEPGMVPPANDGQRRTWDPLAYPDADRPKGWYIDPSDTGRMTHWGGPELPEWNGETRTPRKIKRAWEAEARFRA